VIVVEGSVSGKRKLYEGEVKRPQTIHRISTATMRAKVTVIFALTLLKECYRRRWRTASEWFAAIMRHYGVDTERIGAQQQALGLHENVAGGLPQGLPHGSPHELGFDYSAEITSDRVENEALGSHTQRCSIYSGEASTLSPKSRKGWSTRKFKCADQRAALRQESMR
jgi:hypothetical protein